MKIIKEGVPYVWSKEFTCTGNGTDDRGCGAVLLVSEEDLYRLYYPIWDGETGSCSAFTCPCCGVETHLSLSYAIKHLGKRPPKKE